jgi:Uma2 family endonuclease
MTVATPELVLRSLNGDWDYARWKTLGDDGSRYEVIDKVLYMTTAPSFFHQWIVQRLTEVIGVPLQRQGEAFYASAPVELLFPGCEPVQPDFMLIQREQAGFFASRRVRGIPDLIVEVLSSSNHDYDTSIKRAAYARAGVPEYWIVRPATRDVLVCWQPDPTLGDFTQSRLVAADSELVATTLPVRLASVGDLFADAPDTTL